MLKFFKGFYFAFQGVSYAFRTQVNFRFHTLMALLVFGAGFLFNITSTEWIVVAILIALVLSAELFNTAIEKLTDLVTTEMHPLAKIAKDCAAGGVFVVAAASAVIGLIIFIPYVLALVH